MRGRWLRPATLRQALSGCKQGGAMMHQVTNVFGAQVEQRRGSNSQIRAAIQRSIANFLFGNDGLHRAGAIAGLQ